MYYTIFFIPLFILCSFSTAHATIDINTNISIDYSNIEEVIKLFGYGSETHKVITDDGYILNIHRVVVTSPSPDREEKGVVLLQHGIFCSSSSFVLSKSSLAFTLANAGYDVWLGNFRGNKYANQHQILSANNFKFWNFSWDEMGKYDLPAIIKYIKYKTSVDKIFYVGHNQGATAYFVLSSTNPQFVEENVDNAFAIAPVVYTKSIRAYKLQLFIQFFLNSLSESLFEKLLSLHSIGDIINITKDICRGQILSFICNTIISIVNETDHNILIKPVENPLISKNFPEGISAKQLFHYAKLVQSGEFTNYDATEIYDVSRCNTPVSIFYSSDDMLANPQDADRLLRQLKNKRSFYIQNENFINSDFLWNKRAPSLVFNVLLEQLDQITLSKHAH